MEQTKWTWINEKEVARMTSRALPTLRNDRHLGRGIPYSKVGRSVRYKISDVVYFMESNLVETEQV